MSLKWQRSRAWDEANIPAWLWPMKVFLRLMSSVWLGVWLLVFVVVYAILASVPIGMLATIPTYLIYGVSFVLPLVLVAGGGSAVVLLALDKWGVAPAARFVATFAAGLALAGVTAWAWSRHAWPLLRADRDTGSGLMLFADVVHRYRATTLRRLPGLEMSELEFYAWWPLRIVLLAFVANMIVATLRRIEFTFRNLGVLTVHTGIVLIALGSIYYSGLKLEGDTVLFAGRAGPDGVPAIGPAQDRFYDNTRVALYVSSGMGREQRPLRDIPRYNDYGLERVGPSGAKTAWEASFRRLPPIEPARGLEIQVMDPPTSVVDPAIRFRVVGYASYATPAEDWIEHDPSPSAAASVVPGERLNPLRVVYLHSEVPDQSGNTTDRPVLAYTLLPAIPARRVAASGELGVEYTMGSSGGMSDERWRDLRETLPAQTEHALVVEVPSVIGEDGTAFRAVYAVKPGSEVAVGSTGYRLNVKELAAQPPFPIITKGYSNATSSVAIVRVTGPDGTAFDRWVYHRFGEINQDMLDEQNASGMPKRRDADPSIRISYIDASPLLQVYFDEPNPGVTRAIVRSRGGGIREVDAVTADALALVPKLTMKIGARWSDATAIQRPMPVPEAERDKSQIGTHDMAMLGVEVSTIASGPRAGAGSGDRWSTVVWLPFTKYVGTSQGAETEVTLPGGRTLGLAFGRLQHQLPGFAVQLVDFKMISYDHRGAPRDYQSTLRVTALENSRAREKGSSVPEFASFEHVTQLNAPLTAPFRWDDDRAWLSNVVGRIGSGLNPFQFKFSQAGWDQQGWMTSQAAVDRGLAKQPSVGFTILGVGNSPGIHLIALGGVLMGAGIPWAFYIKPYLVRREKRKIQAQLAAGTYTRPGVLRTADKAAGNGVPVQPAEMGSVGAES